MHVKKHPARLPSENRIFHVYKEVTAASYYFEQVDDDTLELVEVSNPQCGEYRPEAAEYLIREYYYEKVLDEDGSVLVELRTAGDDGE